MYIEPNSTVILLKDIPWNNNYEATMWFGDIIAQAYYFSQPNERIYFSARSIHAATSFISHISTEE